MEAGALGIGSSLIYAPGFYAKTEELIELCKVAARYQGKYISHLRSEGDRFLEARRRADPHQPRGGAAGRDLPPEGGGRVELAEDGPGHREDRGRAQGGPGRSPPTCTRTPRAPPGFDACVPPLVAGGRPARLPRAPRGRRDARAHPEGDRARPGMGYENLCLATGSPERILLVGFKTDALKPLTGKHARRRSRRRAGKDPVRRDAGPHERGPDAHRGRVLPDVGGQRPQADPAALGLVRLGRVVHGAGGRRSLAPPPTRARTATSRACSASTCARRS